LKKSRSGWKPLTATDGMRMILGGVDPWLAFGQFLDDWHRTDLAGRPDLVSEPLPDVPPEQIQWAALFTAAVDSLCDQDDLPTSSWTSRPEYWLSEPWFLYPGLSLRAWQLIETPVPFRMRNIFGGDRILSRV
jgi:hypothetical protein